ncbi:MAG: ABC transporter permease [Actinomycetota bacterium]
MSSLGEPGGPVRRSGVGELATSGSAALFDLGVRSGDDLVRNPGGERAKQSFGRRFLRHPLAVAGAVVLLALTAAAVFAPVLAPSDPTPVLTTTVLADAREGPSRAHPLGTDKLGRDQLSRVLYGLRVSLTVGVGVALLSVVVGVAVGAWAGWRGGWVDSALMRITDLFLVIPALVVLLVVANNPDPEFFGLFDLPPATKVPGMVLLLAALGWMPMARIVRGEFLSLREREYVDASRAAGASSWRIVFTHLLPNSLGSIVVFATLAVGIAVLNEAVLSFLGAGVQYPTVSLGQMIADAEDTVGTDLAYLILYPGLVLFVLVLAVNLVGDGLRDAIDPHSRG